MLRDMTHVLVPFVEVMLLIMVALQERSACGKLPEHNLTTRAYICMHLARTLQFVET